MDYLDFARKLERSVSNLDSTKRQFHKAVGHAFSKKQWLEDRDTGEYSKLLSDLHDIDGYVAPHTMTNILKNVVIARGYEDSHIYALAYLAFTDEQYSRQLDLIEKTGIGFGHDLTWLMGNNDAQSSDQKPQQIKLVHQLNADRRELKHLLHFNGFNLRLGAILSCCILSLLALYTLLYNDIFSSLSPSIDTSITQEARLLAWAEDAYQDNRPEQFYKHVLALSRLESPIGLAGLAVAYVDGLGVVPDLDKASTLASRSVQVGLKKAAHNEQALAQYFYARLLLSRLVDAQDTASGMQEVEGRNLLDRASDNGSGPALLFLASEAFFSGKAEDSCYALETANRAVNAGSLAANVMVAQILIEGLCSGVTPQNDLSAYHLAYAAHEFGLAEGTALIGFLTWHGRGTEKDVSVAMRLYTQAAESGNLHAQLFVARNLASGQVVDYDPRKANYWYKKATAQGEPEAEFALGEHYQLGIGTSPNSKLARSWYRKAAESGHTHAQFRLAGILEEDNETYQNITRALEWYAIAANKGHIAASIRLSQILHHGIGMDKNEAQARYWIDSAAQNLIPQVSEYYPDLDLDLSSDDVADFATCFITALVTEEPILSFSGEFNVESMSKTLHQFRTSSEHFAQCEDPNDSQLSDFTARDKD